jgi:hypothetical protein
MRMRNEPADEYMHTLGPEPNFNESMYFNVYDPKPDVGAWFRLGNRANEGYAEMTVCIYLPSGVVAFMFARPKIDNNDAFDAGGMKFDVIEPFKKLRVRYEGKVALVTDPHAMKDPRSAFESSEHVDCLVDLDYRGLSPMLGGEPEYEEGELRPAGAPEFARGHTEQHVGATGRIVVGADAWDVDGFGLRDHSWGPRFWQNIPWYRWLTANAGPDKGFMINVTGTGDGRTRRSGVLFENGGYTPIVDAKLESTWVTGDKYHDRIDVLAKTPDREFRIEGIVKSLIPLRNRRAEQMTRITEGLTEWRWEGHTGYGLSEYLDQIVDGKPVGD